MCGAFYIIFWYDLYINIISNKECLTNKKKNEKEEWKNPTNRKQKRQMKEKQ